jgi:putative transposase
MTNYRRNFAAGASFFFTVNLADRSQHLLTQHIDLLRASFKEVRRQHSSRSTPRVVSFFETRS